MEQFLQALSVIAGVLAYGSLVALVVERLVEKFATYPLERAGWPSEVKAYIALLIGGIFSGAFAIDLFTPLALAVGLQPFVPWAGYVLTGLLIGGGANLVHDVWPGNEPQPAHRNNVVGG